MEQNKNYLEQTRDYSMDNIKGLMIFCVVFAHLMNLDDYPSNVGNIIYTFIYFFHMPMFIFIAGYFSKNVNKCREKAISTYFIPYLILTVTSYLHLCFVKGEVTKPFRIFKSSTGCWFLFVLFLYKYFLKDILKLRFSIAICLAMGLLTGFSHEFSTRFAIQRAVVFSAFFVMGYYVDEKMIAKIRAIPKWITCLATAAILYVTSILVKVPHFYVELLHCKKFYRDDYTKLDFSIRVIFYLIAICMIVIIINLTYKKKCFLSKIGRNSLSVYVLHLFVMRRVDWIYDIYGKIFPNKWVYLIALIGFAALCTFIFSRDIFCKLIKKLFSLVNRIIFRMEELPKKKNAAAQ